MGLFDFFKKQTNSSHLLTQDKSSHNLTSRADTLRLAYEIYDQLEPPSLNRSEVNLYKEINDMLEKIDQLEKLQLEYSNLQLSTDLLFIKSSVNLLVEKYKRLSIFTKYDDVILEDLENLIHKYSSFVTSLLNKVVADERKMIESIIDTTLNEVN